MAALSITVIAALSQQPAAQAGPEATPVTPESLLPQSVGIAVDTQAAITISFETPMDTASVESALELLPAQPVRLSWNKDRTALSVSPGGQWRTDERYLVVVGSDSATADGTSIRAAQRFAFTTSTAPAVTDFQVHLAGAEVAAAKAEAVAKEVSLRSAMATDTGARSDTSTGPQPIGVGATTKPPTDTATKVSADSSISIDFSVPMDREDVEERFTITPEIDGSLSWKRGSLVFTPAERLNPGTRYTISVIGSHDLEGNPLGGEGNFTFVVQSSATLSKTDPGLGATDVEPAKLTMTFTHAMNRKATASALSVVDTATGTAVAGTVTWNKASTQLTFTPDAGFAGGHAFEVSLGKGGKDADGNAVKAKWSFTTKATAVVVAAPAAPAAPAPTTASAPVARSVPPAAPATSLAGAALNQVNAARAAYGFGPVVLDASISAVAASHAMDQARNGYFSHTGLDGSSRETRLARGGVSWDWWTGENQCYHEGMSQQATLNWCHAQFMAEPYPGHWNHIANILNPNARRMGVGIATVGSRTVIVWNFAD